MKVRAVFVCCTDFFAEQTGENVEQSAEHCFVHAADFSEFSEEKFFE